MSDENMPPDVLLTQLIFGKWVSMAISVAARLRVADKLADGARSIAELATETKTHEASLFRLMRALASVGVFSTDENGRFQLTDVGQLLRTGVKGSLRGVADFLGAEWSWRAWENLVHSVRTGETAFEKVYGENVFAYLSKHADESAVFDEGMTGFSGKSADAVADAYDFSRFKTLADIGGGHGYLLSVILRKYPGLRGIVFDAPHVVSGASAILTRFELSDRCTTVGGDFFQSVPGGCDAYIMKHIIHDWNDRDSERIIRTIRSAAKPGSCLLLVEMVIPTGDAPHPGKLLDLEMLVVASGKERTEQEYQQLLLRSGYRLCNITSTRSPVSVIEAEAV
jgi:O-methyltransferase domain